MATLHLDFFVLQTYNVKTLAIVDTSTYPTVPPAVTSPSIKIVPPAFPYVEIPFVPQSTTVYNSFMLGLSAENIELPLPDGIYHITYSNSPAYDNYVSKTFMRVDQIQEKFDNAFLKLDMMECHMELKAQAKVELNSISYLIQGSIATANNCAELESVKLYNQANKMLDRFIQGNCGCGN